MEIASCASALASAYDRWDGNRKDLSCTTVSGVIAYGRTLRSTAQLTHSQLRRGRTAGCAHCYADRSPAGDWSVTPSPLSALRSTSEPCLPSELERLLLDVVADGFVLYCCGPIAAPYALVASYQWKDCVDLVTIRCFEQVTTARVPLPRHGPVDVFAPEMVVWGMKGRHGGHCGHYSISYPPSTLTLLLAPTRRHPQCTFPALSNAR